MAAMGHVAFSKMHLVPERWTQCFQDGIDLSDTARGLRRFLGKRLDPFRSRDRVIAEGLVRHMMLR